jgi:hypothetical protein
MEAFWDSLSSQSGKAYGWPQLCSKPDLFTYLPRTPPPVPRAEPRPLPVPTAPGSPAGVGAGEQEKVCCTIEVAWGVSGPSPG